MDHGRPRLVKDADGPDLSAFSVEQRTQLRAWLAAERDRERQVWRDVAQGLGAVVAALRRLGGVN